MKTENLMRMTPGLALPSAAWRFASRRSHDVLRAAKTCINLASVMDCASRAQRRRRFRTRETHTSKNELRLLQA
jgi:hypothetical protein